MPPKRMPASAGELLLKLAVADRHDFVPKTAARAGNDAVVAAADAAAEDGIAAARTDGPQRPDAAGTLREAPQTGGHHAAGAVWCPRGGASSPHSRPGRPRERRTPWLIVGVAVAGIRARPSGTAAAPRTHERAHPIRIHIQAVAIHRVERCRRRH